MKESVSKEREFVTRIKILYSIMYSNMLLDLYTYIYKILQFHYLFTILFINI